MYAVRSDIVLPVPRGIHEIAEYSSIVDFDKCVELIVNEDIGL